MGSSIAVEHVDDAPAVDQVLRRAFRTQPGVADMVAAIRTSAQYEPGLSLVAKDDDSVVGFVMVSHAVLVDGPAARHDVLTLSPLGVDPGHERRGIGSALVRDVLGRADDSAAVPRLVTLEGDPGLYARLGFEPADRHGVVFDLPGWAPPMAGQVHRLSGHDARMRGRVSYPDAFRLAER